MIDNKNLKTDYTVHLDHICTMLAKGEVWHKKAANECRKIGMRGMGRYHDAEGMTDAIELFEMGKILCDKMHYYGRVDYTVVAHADTYNIANNADFKRHFGIWDAAEKELAAKITEFLPHAMVDMDLYKKLTHILHNVQNEIFRLNIVKNSLEFAGWNPHDISVKSKWLHDYFENTWKLGCDIDFNIG